MRPTTQKETNPSVLLLVRGVLLCVGLGLAALSIRIAVVGTGGQIPDDAIDGTVVAQETSKNPAGKPFISAHVSLSNSPSENKGALGQTWGSIEGSKTIRVKTKTGESEVTLPPYNRWRGAKVPEQIKVASLAGIPIVGEINAREKLSPPYFVTVVPIREGDHVLVAGPPSEPTQLLIGETKELQKAIKANEAMRWPIVFLLFAMGLISFIIVWRLGKK